MKSGIDYFPLDVNMDEKVELIEAEFGLTGFAILVKLLQRIYGSEGWYVEWTNEVALLFAKRVGAGGSVVSEIVEASIKRGIFDKTLYDKYRILTSTGIQRRYFEAVSRRKNVKVKAEYLLIDVTKILSDVDIIGENVYINQKNADILKQSKVKKSKSPLYPPKGEGERDFKGEFFKAYPKLKLGRTDDSFVDYSALLKAFARSDYLRTRYSMHWVLENYDAVIRGDFADAESAEGVRAARESWYAERRAAAEERAHKALQQALKDEAYAAADGWVRQLAPRIAFEKDEKLAEAMQAQLDDAERAKTERLKELGLDIQVHYHCTKCSDTGFLPNGRPCNCYNKED